MQYKNYLKRKLPFFTILGVLLILSSCGSYQYVGADNDGIYGDTPQPVRREVAVVEVPNADNSNNYYKNYFRTKSLELETLTENGEIFTDIDAYENENYIENDSLTNNNYIGYAGWGQNSNGVTINYIDNGFNNIWWNDPFISPWGWNNWGWGNRWNNWGWNRWNNWGWNNWGYYDPFWGGGLYGGWGFNAGWGYNRFFNNRYNNYYGRRASYSASRRGSYARVSPNNVRSVNRRSDAVNSRNVSKYNTLRRRSTSAIANRNYNRGVSANTARRSSGSIASRNYNPNSRSANSVRRTTPTAPTGNSTARSSTARRSSSTIPRSSNGNSAYKRSSSSRNSGYNPSRSSSPSRSSGSTTRSSSGSRSSGGTRSSSGGGRRRG